MVLVGIRKAQYSTCNHNSALDKKIQTETTSFQRTTELKSRSVDYFFKKKFFTKKLVEREHCLHHLFFIGRDSMENLAIDCKNTGTIHNLYDRRY